MFYTRNHWPSCKNVDLVGDHVSESNVNLEFNPMSEKHGPAFIRNILCNKQKRTIVTLADGHNYSYFFYFQKGSSDIQNNYRDVVQILLQPQILLVTTFSMYLKRVPHLFNTFEWSKVRALSFLKDSGFV